MNRRTVALAAVGVLLLSATVAVQAEETEKGSCQIEGTWYGFNTVGETYLFTINKAKGKGYTAVGQSPATPAPFFSFVTGELAGTHAYLTKVGRNSFDSTWMTMSWVDPGYDFDFDPFFGTAGCGTGWDLMAIKLWGPLTMPTCDSWTVEFDFEIFVYMFGTDPYVDGCSLGNPFGPGSAFYKRLQ